MASKQSEEFETEWMYMHPDISDRYELELSSRYNREESDVDDKLNLNMRDRVGPRLWNTLCTRQPRISSRMRPHVFNRHNAKEPAVTSDRNVQYRINYMRSRRMPFSNLRTCTRNRPRDELCRPFLHANNSRDNLETSEEDIGNSREHSEIDTRGRPNPQVTCEFETNMHDKHECSFMCFWRIENFCIDETSQSCCINSQMFDVLMIDGAQWQLRLEHSQFDSLSLQLYRLSKKECCDINVELSVLTTDGWHAILDDIYSQFSSTTPCIGTKLIDWFELSQVKNYLPDDCLTVNCHISIQSSLFNPVQYFMPSRMISHKLVVHSPMLEFSDLKPNEVLNFPIPGILLEYLSVSDKVETKSTQTEDRNVLFNESDEDGLEELFKTKTSCYVTLRTPTKDFAVHKAIICAKSPVFNTLLRETITEQNNVLDVIDIDVEVLSLMLRYFYLEPLGELEWDDAAKLYDAANKYQTELLKAECRSFLKKTLSVKNICDTFILADTHKDEELREISQEYFCKNSKTILCSSEWNQFLYNRVDLASKVLYRYGELM